MPKFLSTLSLRRATGRHRGNNRGPIHFYPRSPCGERHSIVTSRQLPASFLSTLSLRRATDYARYYIHAREISIHALLAESDGHPKPGRHLGSDFYPRSPCGERRITIITTCTAWKFLSTLSLRRATETASLCVETPVFLSTLSLRRATLSPKAKNESNRISIHALLAESDNCTSIGRPKRLYFYPRSPCGERRQVKQTHRVKISISIHALLAESDARFSSC